jgi:hypothetical protein
MSHTPSCRTRVERFGLITVHYTEPDAKCKDASHDSNYTEENK